MKDVKCLICGNVYKQITTTHLRNAHGITIKEYRMRFPDAVIARYSASDKKRMSEGTKRAMQRPEVREKVKNNAVSHYQVKYWVDKGFTEDEACDKISALQRATHANRDSDSYVSHWSTQYWIARGCTDAEAREKVSQIQARNSAKSSRFSGHTRSEESKHKIARSMRAHIQSVGAIEWVKHTHTDGFGSKIEGDVATWVRENVDASAKRNVNRNGYIVDIVSSDDRVAIEVFGDFWHGHDRLFNGSDTHPVTGTRISEIRAKDTRRLNTLRGVFDNVLVVWEHAWEDSKANVISQIKTSYEN